MNQTNATMEEESAKGFGAYDDKSGRVRDCCDNVLGWGAAATTVASAVALLALAAFLTAKTVVLFNQSGLVG